MSPQTLLALVPYMLALIVLLAGYLEQRMPQRQKQQIDTAHDIIWQVVHAVEQTKYMLTGSQKKLEVMASVNGIFQVLHISIPPTLVDSIIEAIVATLPPSHPPISTQTTQPNQIIFDRNTTTSPAKSAPGDPFLVK